MGLKRKLTIPQSFEELEKIQRGIRAAKQGRPMAAECRRLRRQLKRLNVIVVQYRSEYEQHPQWRELEDEFVIADDDLRELETRLGS